MIARRARSALLLLVGVVLVALAGCGADAAEQPTLGPREVTVELGVEHSFFDDEALRVVEGTTVHFVVDNTDPIGHELIVGPPEVHERHASGTHAAHGTVDGEVSVGANTQARTTYRFDEVGTVEFACHLPGHYEHGMHGEVEVVRRG